MITLAQVVAAPPADVPQDAAIGGWETTLTVPKPPDRWVTWSGASGTKDSMTGYGGATFSPGGDRTRDGFRLRLEGGSGTYGYITQRTFGPLSIMGESTFGAALVGYQVSRGPWTAKAFAGIAYERHILGPDDPDNEVNGKKVGFKLALEGWRNVGTNSFLALDANYSSPFGSYAANAKVGLGVWENIWLGVEAGAYGNSTLNAMKGGGFVRWRTGYGTLWLSGGVGGDYDDPETPYGTVLMVRSF
ncbi:MAG: cellulose biosynthesis protein BcsS [Pseudomonadota bacterium]